MPSNDPDIRNEPHLQQGAMYPKFDPAIDTPLGLDSAAVEFSIASEEDIDHSVWAEPTLNPDVSSAVPESALTYRKWLDQRTSSWSEFSAWTVTFGVVSLSIPFAAFAAIVSWVTSNLFVVSDLIVACLMGPLLQELCKILVPLWIVEKRPYFFTTWFQFLLIAIVTATTFSVVSNFFLSLAVPEVTTSVFIFQWVGVLGLNLITASIANFGLEKIWRTSIKQGKPPRLEIGYPYFATAIGLHVVFAIGTTIWFWLGGLGRLMPL